MRNLIILNLVLLASCRDARLVPKDVCGQPCFEDDPKKQFIGTCHPGVWECSNLDGGYFEATCVGSSTPSFEYCDNLDNNCDGKIDEGALNCCHNPTQEVCDGKDNDCDGQIDEPEDLPVKIPEDFCYHANPNTINVGICRAGIMRCVDGKMSCDGEVIPSKEICDKADNDCNGIIDDREGDGGTVDLVFVVDNSCSMSATMSGVNQSTQKFATRYNTSNDVKWALVTAPDMDAFKWWDKPHLFQQFTDAKAFSYAMSLQDGTSGSSDEPTLDAIYNICNPGNPFGLNWRAGSRRYIILYTDENPQSYQIPSVAPFMVSQVCADNHIPVYAFVAKLPFVSQGSYFNGDWLKITKDTNGNIYDLKDPTSFDALDKLVNDVICGQ